MGNIMVDRIFGELSVCFLVQLLFNVKGKDNFRLYTCGKLPGLVVVV